MNDLGKVSIVIPAYNCAPLIEEAFRRAQRQSYQDWELLYMDRHSTDGSDDIVRRLAKEDGRFKLYRLKTNINDNLAREVGVDYAEGRWVVFCDLDIQWNDPERLAKQVRYMVESGCSISYGPEPMVDKTQVRQDMDPLEGAKMQSNDDLFGVVGSLPRRYFELIEPTYKEADPLKVYTQVLGYSAFVPDNMSSAGRVSKRLFGIFVAGICLVVFSPLWLICAICVKLEDGGPVIYKQERIGKGGKPFKIWKFRTMRVDAENHGPQLCKAAKQLDDPRCTKMGKFFRAHHLDELPQLWNVFVGDMAFVGPRPERQFYIEKIMKRDPRYTSLFQVRPGVTSYSTLYNGYCDTIDKMVTRLHYDLEYLQKRSLWFDIKILWMTFQSIALGKKF